MLDYDSMGSILQLFGARFVLSPGCLRLEACDCECRWAATRCSHWLDLDPIQDRHGSLLTFWRFTNRIIIIIIIIKVRGHMKLAKLQISLTIDLFHYLTAAAIIVRPFWGHF